MKLSLLKRVVVIAVISIFCSDNVIYAQINITGTWKLNFDRSEFGQVPIWAAASEYSIKQNDEKMEIDWIIINENNESKKSHSEIEKFGTSISILLPSGRTRTMSVKKMPGDTTLSIVKSYSKVNDAATFDYEISEVWSLADNGKTLLIQMKTPSYVIKAIYEKQ